MIWLIESEFTFVWQHLQKSMSVTFSLLLVGAVIANAIYNRYFHPLRHFPGPFWAGISDFWKFYIFLTKESHTRGIELHERYGPVVRVAPNFLAFNDPKLLPKVYHRYADKTDFYSAGIFGGVTPPFQTLDHTEHAAKRRRVAPSFSMSNLKTLQGKVDDAITEFDGILREKFAKRAEKVDFAEWVKWFVYDTISNIAFGEPIGFVREGRDVGGLIQAWHNMTPLAGLVGTLPWLVNPILQNPLLGRFFMPKSGDATGTGKIMQYRDKMLKDRFKNRHSGHHGDFLDNILSATNPDGTLMTIEEVNAEAFVLMVAGTDTSTAFIGSFIHNVIQSPQTTRTLLQEIQDFDRVGKLSSPVATVEETKQLPYFLACVKETLRFAPPIPFILPRYVSKGGLDLNGIWVPQGTEIAANAYVTNRDKATFGDDADYFRPERWLEGEEKAREMDRYMLSWGYGARVCLGKNIAQMVTQKLCLHLFRNFHIRSATPEKPWRCENLIIMIYWDQWLLIEERSPDDIDGTKTVNSALNGSSTDQTTKPE